MVSSPKISVVMPAYNAQAHLDEAVSSILGQTFGDFEFIIINDGSTDDTASILKRYAEHDGRIRLYHQENQGLISALNRGCRLARGEYIARMDADDVSLPRRLEKQVEYLASRPQIGILGTWIYRVQPDGSIMETWCPPTNPQTLKWLHFFGVCVSHPTVLMRRDILERVKFYRPDALYADDRDLWLRASAITDFGNVPEPLLSYRVWNGSVSQRRHRVLRDTQVGLLYSFIKEFLQADIPIEAVAGLGQSRFQDPRQIRMSAELLQELYHKFLRENVLTSQARNEISWDAAKRLARLALEASRFDPFGSMRLFRRALQLDYRLLRPSAVMKGVQQALQQRSTTESARRLNKVLGIVILISLDV